jgi:hypothetical protein
MAGVLTAWGFMVEFGWFVKESNISLHRQGKVTPHKNIKAWFRTSAFI